MVAIFNTRKPKCKGTVQQVKGEQVSELGETIVLPFSLRYGVHILNSSSMRPFPFEINLGWTVPLHFGFLVLKIATIVGHILIKDLVSS
jgi:sporulation-control protein spo0M